MAMKKNQHYDRSDPFKRNKKKTQRPRSAGLQEALGLSPGAWRFVLAICLVLVAATIGIRALIALSTESPLIVEAGSQRPLPAKQSAEKVERPATPPRETLPSAGETTPRANTPKRAEPAPRETTSDDDSKGLVGVEVFPPLGTKPNISGIIVPDDFELPPGYVRHYQTSDDGSQLEPILMYHPKRRPVDAQGDPIDVPPDRIVPPEMAPEGLPVRTLQLPETRK